MEAGHKLSIFFYIKSLWKLQKLSGKMHTVIKLCTDVKNIAGKVSLRGELNCCLGYLNLSFWLLNVFNLVSCWCTWKATYEVSISWVPAIIVGDTDGVYQMAVSAWPTQGSYIRLGSIRASLSLSPLSSFLSPLSSLFFLSLSLFLSYSSWSSPTYYNPLDSKLMARRTNLISLSLKKNCRN